MREISADEMEAMSVVCQARGVHVDPGWLSHGESSAAPSLDQLRRTSPAALSSDELVRRRVGRRPARVLHGPHGGDRPQGTPPAAASASDGVGRAAFRTGS